MQLRYLETVWYVHVLCYASFYRFGTVFNLELIILHYQGNTFLELPQELPSNQCPVNYEFLQFCWWDRLCSQTVEEPGTVPFTNPFGLFSPLSWVVLSHAYANCYSWILSSLVLFHMNCSCLFFLDSQLHVLNLGGLPSSASVSLLSAVTWKLSQGCKMEFVIELTLVVSHFSGVTGLHCLMSVFSKLLFHIVG